jgi:hypothetical protein
LKLLGEFDHRRGSSRKENTMGASRGASFTSSEWWRTTLFDVDLATIGRWKGKHSEFCKPLKREDGRHDLWRDHAPADQCLDKIDRG